MNFATDVVGPLAWSVAGFVIGFLVAQIGRDVHEIKEAAVSDDDAPYSGPERRRRKRPPTNGQMLGVLIVLLSVATVTLLSISNAQQRAVMDCQSDVNRQLVQTINERSRASATDKQALDDMLAAVLTLKTPEQRRAAVERYVEVSKQTAAQRAQHPFPEPQDFDCKEAR